MQVYGRFKRLPTKVLCDTGILLSGLDAATEEKIKEDEAEIHRLLGMWVSESDPVQVISMRGRLIGLGRAGTEFSGSVQVVLPVGHAQ
ncbi:hypothetical protein [Parvibaculum sp.]|uniref:hypothetical protein n=1 Tax=Parvibaculum sp. TaxID=2024848 RepID=UPI002734C066|nr:hypothetical protein [Parvibaculum sp.]MDP3328768.1 hypothetical protein [Parvibaculum sp.]